jgi:hypothetical protein
MTVDDRPERKHPIPDRDPHPRLEPTPLMWRGPNGSIPIGKLDDLALINCIRAMQAKIPNPEERPRVWDGLVIEALRRGYGWAEWVDPLA